MVLGGVSSFCDIANQGDVVAFNHDSAYVSPCPLLPVYLGCFIKYHVHEFIETLKKNESKASSFSQKQN